MIPQEFTYERPETVADALAALERHGGDARVLAGGHSLIPMMKLRIAAPEVLVDIGRIAELSGIRETGDGLTIGALTRHADVASSELVQRVAPVLAQAAAGIGDRQVRARGTIGGALAHADPHGDLPAVLLALGGSVEVQGPNGSRTIAADDLFVSLMTTSLEPGEILTAVHVPAAPHGAYVKFTRRAQDWAIIGVCAVVNGGVRPDRHHRGGTARGARHRGRERLRRFERRSGRRAGGRGADPRERRGRVGGVPPAPHQGAHPPGARGGRGLTPHGRGCISVPGTDMHPRAAQAVTTAAGSVASSAAVCLPGMRVAARAPIATNAAPTQSAGVMPSVNSWADP